MSSPTPSIFEDLPPIDFSSTNAYNNSSDSDDASIDSLFDEPPSIPTNSRIPRHGHPSHPPIYPAKRDFSALSSDECIPGLFYDPAILISLDLETRVINECLQTWFIRPRNAQFNTQVRLPLDSHSIGLVHGGSPPEGSIQWEFNDVNQVMLFNRTDGILASGDPVDQLPRHGWPPCLTALLAHISLLFKPPVLDPTIWDILFSPTGSAGLGEHRSRQAIINLYKPGEGISDHVDLLDRYGDGIIGVSFGTGCVMRFRRAHGDDHRHTDECGCHHIDPENPLGESDSEAPDRSMFTEIYLPPRSILIMTGEARYKWTHGIQGTDADLVQPEPTYSAGAGTGLNDARERGEEGGIWIERGMRLSVTFRWLLPGADVVGS